MRRGARRENRTCAEGQTIGETEGVRVSGWSAEPAGRPVGDCTADLQVAAIATILERVSVVGVVLVLVLGVLVFKQDFLVGVGEFLVRQEQDRGVTFEEVDGHGLLSMGTHWDITVLFLH